MSSYGEIQVAGGDTATPLCLRKRLRVIAAHLPGQSARMLDCGCGAGEYVRALRNELRVDACGVEFSPDKVQVALQDAQLAPYIQQGDIGHLPFDSASFDAALLNEVLEHVPDESRALQEIHRILKDQAVLILLSPNRWFPFETHGVFTRRGKRVPPWVPLVPYVPLAVGRKFLRYWARNYWPHELKTLLTANGFQLQATDFVWQTFENISGQQPFLIRRTKRFLRLVADACEKTPVIRRFGVTQVLIGRKSQR